VKGSVSVAVELQQSKDGDWEPLAALALAAEELARGSELGAALRAVALAAARASGADLALVRLLDGDSVHLTTQAVQSESAALAAELEGIRASAAEIEWKRGEIPPSLRAAADRVGATAVHAEPIRAGGATLGVLELLRDGPPFDDAERMLARLAAAQAAAALRACPPLPHAVRRNGGGRSALELAGEALAVGSDEARTAEELTRVAQAATGAAGCALFRLADGESPELVAAFGRVEHTGAAMQGHVAGGAPAAGGPVVVPIDDPPRWALVLVPGPSWPFSADPSSLAAFAARAAQALRASERTRDLAADLDRTSALLAVVAGANADLSLSRTVERVADRMSELLGIDRVAVYLRDEERLVTIVDLRLAGPHEAVAERLLEISLGARGSRAPVVVADAVADARFEGLADILETTQIESAIAVPLLVPGGLTGLLALYPERSRTLGDDETALISTLAAQLAVAVQNATLHEQATQMGVRLEHALAQEREQARELGALYEISSSFTESLSLEPTLGAVARTVVDLLDVDAAVIHLPDARGETLVARARHVADLRLADAVSSVLERPQPLERLTGRRFLRMGRPLLLDAELVAVPDGGFDLLLPFLEAGSTAMVLPLLTQSELLGTLTILSLDPARRITEATTRIALPVAKQAALTIDNARLYQHQKAFSDTMARSLLPRTQPTIEGLEVGHVYESSAHVEVGGDVYDFLTLDDGRLAVVLGDVTGHGVEAAADMAMAKFVFRSLARQQPEPSDFLAAANEIVCDDIAPGKFITMIYLAVDGATRELACATAGHPSPRIVLPDGTVRPLEARGLALGIETGQRYLEVRETLVPGACVVVYTDGVVEARRGREFFGSERLDSVLSELRALPAEALAQAVLAECSAFTRGELADDCAIVVIRVGQPQEL
jgi:serine phosphatase RsbU (regulator of sigma subunit)